MKNLFKKQASDNKETNRIHVIIEDPDLQIVLARWFDIIPIKEVEIKHYFLSGIQAKDIATKFAVLLRLTGLAQNEICTLRNFDKESLTFDCYFSDKDDKATISLAKNFIVKEFTVNYHNEIKTYRFLHWNTNLNEPSKFELIKQEVEKANNDNYVFKLMSGDYTFNLTINQTGSAYYMENILALQEYLLELTIPFAINEVFKKICEISISHVETYPSLIMEVTKNDGGSKKTVDKLSLSYGHLDYFAITIGDRTVTIDFCNGCWRLETPQYKILQNMDGTINYSLTNVPVQEFTNAPALSDQYEQAVKEVEQVRSLAKSINL